MDSSDEWTPVLDFERDNSTRLKWGLNSETREVTVWDVAGPGDGFPSHQSYLTAAWGRAPRVARGDVLGFAEWHPPTLAIHVYGGVELPEAVDVHFRAAFPAARITIG